MSVRCYNGAVTRHVEAPEPPPKPPKRKQRRIEFRVDEELAERAERVAKDRGWSLSSILRLFLARFADEADVDPSEVGEHAARAPKGRKKK